MGIFGSGKDEKFHRFSRTPPQGSVFLGLNMNFTILTRLLSNGLIYTSY